MAEDQQSKRRGEDASGSEFREAYRRGLRRSATGGALEFAGGLRPATVPEVQDRVEAIRGDLLRIVNEVLGGDREATDLVERLTRDGAEALELLGNDDPKLAPGSKHAEDLEAIVRADGTRPSFLITNGEVDLETSPVGTWQGSLTASADRLANSIACVGRIDVDGIHEGTGFLVAKDVICTNRHVLQGIARFDAGSWQVKPKVTIDFGQEFRGRASLDQRKVLEVLFAGAAEIDDPIDYEKLDLVLLRVSDSATPAKPVLSVDIAPDWADGEPDVYVIGYAAKPGPGYTPSLLELLFKITWGKKRLAPGSTLKPRATDQAWTFGHDCTTLNGNSGSLVVVIGRENMAAGIHFGGRKGELAENWGHIFGQTLAASDMTSKRSLKECLQASGVELLDRVRK